MSAAVSARGRREVFVVACAAVTPFGLGADALVAGLDGRLAAAPSAALASSHPALLAHGVAAVPTSHDPVPIKARKTMSRGAYLGALGLRAVLDAAGWGPPDGVGYFLGVGASGGSMTDLAAIRAATFGDARVDDDGLDLGRFGAAGIAACNPLLAFQLMNNFTMCHGAILAGTAGPSGAFFSRGAGTVAALIEAIEAVAGGDCERAIAGGADSALHPVTWIEHERLADLPVRLPPSEGAGLLALAAAATDDVAIAVEHTAHFTRAQDPAARVAAALAATGPCDRVLVAADDPGQRDALIAAVSAAVQLGSLDPLGTCLAATPALGWVAAVLAVQAGATRVGVVTLDGAGDLSVAVFARHRRAP